jgi:hypothetical protein
MRPFPAVISVGLAAAILIMIGYVVMNKIGDIEV